MIALLSLMTLFVQTPQVSAQGFEIEPAVWRSRDLEGRWQLLEREYAENGWKNAQALARFLENEREVELLEWLCLYAPAEGQFALFEGTLAALDAPQWARVVEWNLDDTDSHTFVSATTAFTQRRPALALGWLSANEGNVHPKAQAALEELRARHELVAADASHLLPPLTNQEVLAHLDPTGPVLDFGERLRAEPGATYLHQIERELRAVAHQQLYGEPWLSRVVALTHHERAEVRAFAWIALGEAARGAIPAQRLAVAELQSVIDDAREIAEVRRAAAMALSRRAEWSPQAWFALHEIARAPTHVAWIVAIARLAEVGDEFTLELLAQVANDVDASRRANVESSMNALRARAASQPLALRDVTATLERTTWTDVTCAALEAARKEWTTRYFARHAANPAVREALAAAASYELRSDLRAELETGPARFADFGERVREWAQRLSAR